MKDVQLPDGWHFIQRIGQHQLWRNGSLLHQVSDEAWEDFQEYVGSKIGRQWALDRGIISA